LPLQATEGKAHVFVGYRPLAAGVEHWAVFVGLRRIQAHNSNGSVSPVECDGSWYEIDGRGKKSKGAANTISCDAKLGSEEFFTRTTFKGSFDFPGTAADLHSMMTQFNDAWRRAHPVYAWNGHNCQMYVKHVVAKLVRVAMVTQNAKYGMAAQLVGVAGMAVAVSGVGLVVFAASALVFFGGWYVKGPH
jgi:hypothetical protein